MSPHCLRLSWNCLGDVIWLNSTKISAITYKHLHKEDKNNLGIKSVILNHTGQLHHLSHKQHRCVFTAVSSLEIGIFYILETNVTTAPINKGLIRDSMQVQFWVIHPLKVRKLFSDAKDIKKNWHIYEAAKINSSTETILLTGQNWQHSATGKSQKCSLSPNMEQNLHWGYIVSFWVKKKMKTKEIIKKKSRLVRVSEGHSEASLDLPRFSFWTDF